jgi:hypothetical protein
MNDLARLDVVQPLLILEDTSNFKLLGANRLPGLIVVNITYVSGNSKCSHLKITR